MAQVAIRLRRHTDTRTQTHTDAHAHAGRLVNGAACDAIAITPSQLLEPTGYRLRSARLERAPRVCLASGLSSGRKRADSGLVCALSPRAICVQ